MKILWFTNIMFPELRETFGKNISNSGGWMQQFKEALSRNNNYKLAIACFDIENSGLLKKKINNIDFYKIPKKEILAHIYDKTIEEYIDQIIEEFDPNIVHIWGTEFPHSLAVAKRCKIHGVKFVVSIQGVISDIANHYCQGIPYDVIKSYTIRDFLRNDNILKQKKKFEKRGEFEKLCLNVAENVIGRTDYDYSVVKAINPNIKYYFCNECLRNSFYTDEKWDIKLIDKNTIFISQAYYSIKGFHYFLDALFIVKQKYKNLRVYVAGGSNPLSIELKNVLRQDSYNRFLRKKIKELGLENCVIFVGNLSEIEMKKRMLKSHIFVSPSLIENSPNSVGEAMLLGLPTISSFVGGVSSMIEHRTSGLLYPYDQPSILAKYICDIFDDDSLALKLSNNEKKKAEIIYDIEKNVNRMKQIYSIICNSND